MSDLPTADELTAARTLIARHECGTQGHNWQVVETYVRPVAVICSRCPARYDVVDPSRTMSVDPAEDDTRLTVQRREVRYLGDGSSEHTLIRNGEVIDVLTDAADPDDEPPPAPALPDGYLIRDPEKPPASSIGRLFAHITGRTTHHPDAQGPFTHRLVGPVDDPCTCYAAGADTTPAIDPDCRTHGVTVDLEVIAGITRQPIARCICNVDTYAPLGTRMVCATHGPGTITGDLTAPSGRRLTIDR